METIFQDMGVFYEEVVAMIGNEKKPSCALKYSKLTPYQIWQFIKSSVRVLHINAIRSVLTEDQVLQKELQSNKEREPTLEARREPGQPLSHIVQTLQNLARRYKVEKEIYQAQVQTSLQIQEQLRCQIEELRKEAKQSIETLKDELKSCIKDIVLKNKTIYHYITQVSDVASEKQKLEENLYDLKSTERLYDLLKSKYVKDRAFDRFAIMKEMGEYQSELRKQGNLLLSLTKKDQKIRELEMQLKVAKIAAVKLSDTERKYKLLSERVCVKEAHSDRTNANFDRLMKRLEDKERNLMHSRKEIERLQRSLDEHKKKVNDLEAKLSTGREPNQNPYVLQEFHDKNEEYKCKILELEKKIKQMAVSESRIKRREHQRSVELLSVERQIQQLRKQKSNQELISSSVLRDKSNSVVWRTPKRSMRNSPILGLKSLRHLSTSRFRRNEQMD